MMACRTPGPRLRPFVSRLWASTPAPEEIRAVPLREHVLPTGGIHLVLRLNGARIVLRDADGREHALGACLVGGVRTRFYARELSAPSASVGALLRPGAARALLGAPADAFAERHTALEDVWGGAALDLRDALAECADASARLDLFEGVLARRLAPRATLDPGIAAALGLIAAGSDIAQAMAASGFSHRHFILRVREAAGLAPKTYGRVLRLRRALRLAHAAPGAGWAEIAASIGYSDQAHFARDFLDLTGVTPGAYRRIAPAHAHHVPVAATLQVKNLQDGRAAGR